MILCCQHLQFGSGFERLRRKIIKKSTAYTKWILSGGRFFSNGNMQYNLINNNHEVPINC